MNSHSPRREDLVEEPVAGVLEELLVLLEPLGRDEAHQDRPVIGVHGRVERDDLVVVREVAAVLLEDLRDVVADELDGQVHDRPTGAVDRGVDLGLVVDLQRLLVAGHDHDAVLRLAEHGVVRDHVVEPGLGFRGDVGVGEEVDVGRVGFDGGHPSLLSVGNMGLCRTTVRGPAQPVGQRKRAGVPSSSTVFDSR